MAFSAGTFGIIRSASSSGTLSLPSTVAGDIGIALVMGTPDAANGTPSVSMSGGWQLVAERTQDVAGLSTDLYVAAFWKKLGASESNPTATVSAGFYAGSARWTARAGAFRGPVGGPTVTATSGQQTPSSPWTPPSVTLPVKSTVVTFVVQRESTFLTLSTANGFTKNLAFDGVLSLGDLSRAANGYGREGVSAGAVTMPTVNVATGQSYHAVAAVTFNLPEIVASDWGVDRIAW